MTAWPAGWPLPPKEHPATGEPVTEMKTRFEQPTEIVRWFGPTPPDRDVYEYDEYDEPRFVRRKTAEEYARDVAAYERAAAEFRRTGGEKVIAAGPATCTIEIRTARGSTATLVTSRGLEGWHVLAWALKCPELPGAAALMLNREVLKAELAT